MKISVFRILQFEWMTLLACLCVCVLYLCCSCVRVVCIVCLIVCQSVYLSVLLIMSVFLSVWRHLTCLCPHSLLACEKSVLLCSRARQPLSIHEFPLPSSHTLPLSLTLPAHSFFPCPLILSPHASHHPLKLMTDECVL